MNEKIINVEHISKIYRLYNSSIARLKEALSISKKKYSHEFYALKDINFSVNKAEAIGIIGTNGSGKSTLLKILTGVLSQTSGAFEVNGKISALLELGAGFNPDYTGRENIYLNGSLMGYTREEMEERFQEIEAFAEIGEYINQPVKTYSSGMFARLAFSVAISVNPDILIVDEALSVGDVFFQNKCFRKFEELKEKGITILLVSHDINSVKQMCNKVLWIEKGVQRRFDTTDVVISEYMDEQRKSNNILVDGDKEEEPSLAYEFVEGGKVFPAITESVDRFKPSMLQILSCFINDENQKVVHNLVVDKIYHCHVVVDFKEPINNVIVGISLENAKGLPLMGFNNYVSSDKVFNVEKPLVMDVTFSFQMPRLIKGEYVISPAVAKGNPYVNEMLSWLNYVAKYNVINNGYNSAIIEVPAEVSAYAHERGTVQIMERSHHE